MSEEDREVFQQKINSNPREKAKHSAAEEKVLAGQAAIKNGAFAESNSAVIDLAAFNVKAAISSAVQQVKNAEQALHTAETSTQGLARCLRKARESLEDAWADTQTVSFANTGVKHAAIAMADVGARAVHAGLRTLRAQALRVGTGAHGHSLDALTKDIPITSSSLFRGDLGKAVAKAATASRNYKALGDCFVLSCLSRPRPPRGLKGKASTSPPFHRGNRPWYCQGEAPQNQNYQTHKPVDHSQQPNKDRFTAHPIIGAAILGRASQKLKQNLYFLNENHE